MKYLKCGLNEVNGIFDTQCFHILCCNYYNPFMVICYLLLIPVLILSKIFRCNGAHKNLRPVFRAILKLELEI